MEGLFFLGAAALAGLFALLKGKGKPAGRAAPKGGGGGGGASSALADDARAALRLIAVGRPAEAAVWIKRFQAGAGLPVTGEVDQATHDAMLAAVS